MWKCSLKEEHTIDKSMPAIYYTYKWLNLL